MSFLSRYSLIIAGLSLVLIVIVLVSVPSDILALQATFIGTELQYASESETRVRTRMDFGDVEHMKTFPKRFGNWLGLDFGSSVIAETLGADLLLLRTYLNTEYYQPVNFVIMQSREPTSFHPPPICYRASGWNIQEEGMEDVTVLDASWATASEPVSISAKRLVADRVSNGETEEVHVVLYFYVKGRLFEDAITLVEVSATAPTEGSYDGVVQELKGFMAETVPYMFEPDDEEEGEVLAIHLARSWGGRTLMGVLAMIPLAIVTYPRMKRS